MRILPPMWASTLWPPGISTRNMALGRVSMTEPSTSMTSSLPDVPFAIPNLCLCSPNSLHQHLRARDAPPGGYLPGRLGNDVSRGPHQEGLAAPPGYDCSAWNNHAKAGEPQLYHPPWRPPGLAAALGRGGH